jgi:fatty acid desaturase
MRIHDYFSKAELQQFLARSDAQAWLAVLTSWALVALGFGLVALWPNPLTILLALIIIGGRQLGFGALMHECGHGSLFATKRLNSWVGQWLCAGPVMYRIDDYMARHLKHHRTVGTAEDPDLSRYRAYPVTQASLRRKLIRDVTGRTTMKFLRDLLQVNAFVETEDGQRELSVARLFSRMRAPIISNLVLFLILAGLGQAPLYLLWVAAYFSTYMVFSRIRNLAEHAAVPDLTNTDPLLNTRTTLASWWERLTFAPNSVNYHLEHHLLPAVPKYRLAVFHRALRAKGLLEQADIAPGYRAILDCITTEPQAQAV